VREPATTITDYLLAVIALLLLLRLVQRQPAGRAIGASMFFCGFAAAAIFGGTWHGFFSDDSSSVQRVIWWLTQVFTAVAASGLAVIGLERIGVRDSRGLLIGSAIFVAALAAYAWRDDRFLVSVMASGIGTALCLAGLLYHAVRAEWMGPALVAAGLLLSLVAAVLQQRGIAIHPVYFDHNATYHLWLFPALALIYAGNRRIATHAEN
jgi:hypothetical protein